MTNFKKARLKTGMSQKEIAITLGVSGPTVSEWESGKKRHLGKIYYYCQSFLMSQQIIYWALVVNLVQL